MCVGGAFDRKVESEGNLAGNEGQPKRVYIKDKTRGAQDFQSKESVTEQDHWGQ